MLKQTNTTHSLKEVPTQRKQYECTAANAFAKSVEAYTAQKKCLGSLISNIDESLVELHQLKDEYDQKHAITKDEDKREHEAKSIATTLEKFNQH